VDLELNNVKEQSCYIKWFRPTLNPKAGAGLLVRETHQFGNLEGALPTEG
jgi:hypothetical protein